MRVTADRLWVTWYRHGLRVLDISDPSAIVEVGSILPPDTIGYTGIPLFGFADAVVRGRLVYIADMENGLYIYQRD